MKSQPPSHVACSAAVTGRATRRTSSDAYVQRTELRQEEMLVTSARGRAIRFAFHLYNNDEDVDACLATVRKHFRPGRTLA